MHLPEACKLKKQLEAEQQKSQSNENSNQPNCTSYANALQAIITDLHDEELLRPYLSTSPVFVQLQGYDARYHHKHTMGITFHVHSSALDQVFIDAYLMALLMAMTIV
jgi:hypothetical protein